MTKNPDIHVVHMKYKIPSLSAMLQEKPLPVLIWTCANCFSAIRNGAGLMPATSFKLL